MKRVLVRPDPLFDWVQSQRVVLVYIRSQCKSRSGRGREAIQILGAKATSVKVNTGTILYFPVLP